ncbi:hypothetical protein HETIRDRAFT_468990 [Heterobasidion irregulare TC 32-1]|uniref:Alkaline phytoceramidase n=1 Tax=Heterobasidion irregulare (strain TC 32-1) TaxID=747525 RepID=W4KP30_HETIT|nr:uncharacterized protein HETIRDRAFT_468990 [Heterobasidion irregulare TC 32-1]ETW87150.1 hypothetical protein HETIRDRAFT_468990 [Heterobasidion irregulare TC 32-1]
MDTSPLQGIWGPVTSTLDWCEANYQFSPYVAEVANTFSNLFTIGIALYGAHLVSKESLPSRYLVGFAGVALVGIGSFAFHATLLYQAQLADELPMIYISSYNIFILFETKRGFTLQSTSSQIALLAALLFDIAFTLSYFAYRNPVYHQIVFASLLFIATYRTTYLLRWSETSKTIPNKKKTMCKQLYYTGAALFAFGFLIWNVDNIFCDALTHWKKSLGWPVAFLLEGHSWWHAYTAAGAYFMHTGTICTTLCIKDDHHKYRVKYQLGLPHVQRVHKTKLN